MATTRRRSDQRYSARVYGPGTPRSERARKARRIHARVTFGSNRRREVERAARKRVRALGVGAFADVFRADAPRWTPRRLSQYVNVNGRVVSEEV